MGPYGGGPIVANRATMLCPYHRQIAGDALKAKRDERRATN